MSDAWTPLHHEEVEDPDGEPAKGAHTDSNPRKDKEKGAPVGLTLTLPPDFISAVWANSDQVLRLALAVEEYTKVLQALLTPKS